MRCLPGIALVLVVWRRLGRSAHGGRSSDAFVPLVTGAVTPGMRTQASPVMLPQIGAAPVAATAAGTGGWASTIVAGSCAAAMLLLTGQREVEAEPKRALVALNANSAKPSTPAGVQNVRRIAANGASFLRGRQVAVRVNKKTNKPIRYLMHVKAGDTVQVVKGKDAGKVTTVLKCYPKWNKVLCLGVNFCIKHVRPQREDEVGQRVQVEAPMMADTVMHYSEKEGVVGNLGIRYEKKGDTFFKVRYNKATGEEIPRKQPPKWVPVLERAGQD